MDWQLHTEQFYQVHQNSEVGILCLHRCKSANSAHSTADSSLSMLIQSKSATRLWAYLLCWTSLNMTTSSCQLSSIHFCQLQAVIIIISSLSSIMLLLLLLFYGNWFCGHFFRIDSEILCHDNSDWWGLLQCKADRSSLREIPAISWENKDKK